MATFKYGSNQSPGHNHDSALCGEIEMQPPIVLNYQSMAATWQGTANSRMNPLTRVVWFMTCHFSSSSANGCVYVMELPTTATNESRNKRIETSFTNIGIDPGHDKGQPGKLKQGSLPLLDETCRQSATGAPGKNGPNSFAGIRINPGTGKDRSPVMKTETSNKFHPRPNDMAMEAWDQIVDAPFNEIKKDPDEEDQRQVATKQPVDQYIFTKGQTLLVTNKNLQIRDDQRWDQSEVPPNIIQRPMKKTDLLTQLLDSRLFVMSALLILITSTILGSCVGIAVIQKRINEINSMLRCPSNDTTTTTTTTSAPTTTTSTTMATSTWSILQPFVKEKSNFPQRNIHRSNNVPYLSLCPEEEDLKGDDIADDPFIGHIADDSIGYHFVPGCRYYFIVNQSRTYDEAQQYCRRYGAFLAVIEDSLEECRIGQKLRKIQGSPTRLWMSGIVMPSTTGLHSSDLLWNDGTLMTSFNDIHICWNVSATRMNRFALDYQTYEPQSQRYGCWNTFDPQSSFDFLCKKCLVWE